MKRAISKLFIVLSLCLFISNIAMADEKAIITGKVIDQKTGDPLIGCRVVLKGTKKGAIAKIGGTYRIKKLTPGVYTIRATYVGYKPFELSNVTVEPGEVKIINIPLVSARIMSEQVVVTAKAVKTTNAAMLKDRQKASAFSDAIAAEEISRGGASDAGEAIKKVTGATTEGGKYVFIRGLGDRYASTQLNGAELPSADPDKKSVHLDLFPSGLIDNIVTTKTATPDKPGNFTGGAVNIATKSFPDKFKASMSFSSSYNSQTSGNANFLSAPSSGSDWAGMDNGMRNIPDVVQQALNSAGGIPTKSQAWKDNDKAQLLDKVSKAFDPVMSPVKKLAPMNRKISAFVGDQFDLFDESFGYVASFSYSNKSKFHENGTLGMYSLTGDKNKANGLTEESNVSDSKGVQEVLWGGMANLTYNLTTTDQIGMNFMYNQSGESTARYQVGTLDASRPDKTYETRVLKYVERNMASYQLHGKHSFAGLEHSNLKWQLSYNNSKQDEPDVRFFTNDYIYDNEEEKNVYDIDQSAYKFPSRYFRNMKEDIKSAKLDYELPLKDLLTEGLKVKSGFFFSEKTREFREHRFDIAQDKVQYDGTGNDFFKQQTGLLDKTTNFNRFGNYIEHYDPNKASYDGNLQIMAVYGMMDWSLPGVMSDFRLIGGVRFEGTDMSVNSLDISKKVGAISENDLLPSVNLVYSVTENMNLRAAFGKTLARPNFREFAPYSSFEYVGGHILIGNDKLERTLINNFDLRWEWFQNPGEIMAVSVFYKDFSNPIERTILNTNKEVQYQNVSSASLYGAEFEFKKRLNFLGDFLSNFQFGANLTLIQSQVDLSDEELLSNQAFDKSASKTRDFQGQSPYIINLDLGYVNFESGTNASLHYNVFGKRLSEVTKPGTPDVYEFARPSLNLVASQKLFGQLKLKLSVRNLLDSKVRKVQSFKDKEYTTQEYSIGRSVSFGLSYMFN